MAIAIYKHLYSASGLVHLRAREGSVGGELKSISKPVKCIHGPIVSEGVLAIYTSYTSLYKIIQYNLLFLVLAIYTSYTSL